MPIGKVILDVGRKVFKSNAAKNVGKVVSYPWRKQSDVMYGKMKLPFWAMGAITYAPVATGATVTTVNYIKTPSKYSYTDKDAMQAGLRFSRWSDTTISACVGAVLGGPIGVIVAGAAAFIANKDIMLGQSYREKRAYYNEHWAKQGNVEDNKQNDENKNNEVDESANAQTDNTESVQQNDGQAQNEQQPAHEQQEQPAQSGVKSETAQNPSQAKTEQKVQPQQQKSSNKKLTISPNDGISQAIKKQLLSEGAKEEQFTVNIWRQIQQVLRNDATDDKADNNSTFTHKGMTRNIGDVWTELNMKIMVYSGDELSISDETWGKIKGLFVEKAA